MSIRHIARLALNLNDPRDKRIHERIQNELKPVAEDIYREYKRGYTEEEIREFSRQAAEAREARERASEAAVRAKAERTEEVRRRLGEPDPEVAERVAELTAEGPVRWSWVRRRLASEGITWNEVEKLRGDDAFSIQRDGNRRWIQRVA